MRVLSYIFVYILPSYLYFVYFFHSIYIYFYLYSSLFIMYFYMLCYIYIISYTFSFFFLTHVPGRLAVVLRVYRVKIVPASVHIPPCLCTHVCLYCPRAWYTAPSSLVLPYVCMRVICVLLSCACAVTHRCKLHIHYTAPARRDALEPFPAP